MEVQAVALEVLVLILEALQLQDRVIMVEVHRPV
jgi:hypothetical protein